METLRGDEGLVVLESEVLGSSRPSWLVVARKLRRGWSSHDRVGGKGYRSRRADQWKPGGPDYLRLLGYSPTPPMLSEAIRSGASIETVPGAVLRVCVEDVRPRPRGILHTAMMAPSSYVLDESASEEEAWLAVP